MTDTLLSSFQSHEPIRWDLKDLPEQIDWILQHPSEAEAIASEASRRLERSAVESRFAAEMTSLIEDLGETH